MVSCAWGVGLRVLGQEELAWGGWGRGCRQGGVDMGSLGDEYTGGILGDGL